MTDRELLLHVHGTVRYRYSLHNGETNALRRLLEEHFAASPTAERLALEERVRNLERIVTSKGYSLNEELEAIAS